MIKFTFALMIIIAQVCKADLSSANQAREKKMAHPAAKSDGLTRIDSEGNYIYDVQDQLRNESMHLRIGTVNNPDVSVEITQYNTSNVTTVDFEQMYKGASKLSVGFDYEYFFTIEAGKLGLQTGFAAQFAEGNGRLASNPAVESIEKFTFITMPIYLGLVYRFEYKDYQYFAPYLSGGGAYTALVEKRDDNSKVNAIGSFGYYAAAGGLINITAFDRDMAADFKTEYDISNLWINFEFRTVQVTSPAFKYENSFIQGGLSFDF